MADMTVFESAEVPSEPQPDEDGIVWDSFTWEELPSRPKLPNDYSKTRCHAFMGTIQQKAGVLRIGICARPVSHDDGNPDKRHFSVFVGANGERWIAWNKKEKE